MLRNLLFKLSVLLCLAVPFNSTAQSNPEDWWVVVGYAEGAWASPFLARIFENEETGELITAFCMQAARDQPGHGDRYYLHTNGLWLMPEDGTLQIMYIFKSECGYAAPVLQPSETCLSFGGPITLTTSCVQGTPVWYKKEALILDEVGRGNSYTTNISWSHYYVRCENTDATCFSEFAHANLALDYGERNPKPSKTEICRGEQVNLSLEPGCPSTQYLGYYDKWYSDSNYTIPVTGSLVAPLTTTTYYLKCVSLSGCTANLNNDESSVTITVDESCTVPCNAPNIKDGLPVLACPGETVILTAPSCGSGFTYLWNTGATSSSITVAVDTSTGYRVKCVSTTIPGCESGDSKQMVTVKPVPTITVNEYTCAADGLTYSVSFDIPAGATLSSPSGTTVAGNVVSGITSGDTITVTVTLNGCTASISVTRVCEIPCDAPNLKDGLPRLVCAGGEATLSAPSCGSGFSYLWSTGETTASIEVSPDSTTTYSLRCVSTTDPGCVSKPSLYLVTVNPIPTITVNEYTCAADGLTYSVSFDIPAGATLTSPSGTTVAGNVVSGITSGDTITVTVTLKGCTASISVNRNCNVPCDAPEPTVTGGGEICIGEEATLVAEGCGTGYTYEWNTGQTTAEIKVNPTTDHTYTVVCVSTEDDECKSARPGSATVTVRQKTAAPTDILATPSEVESGGESLLTANCTGGLIPNWFTTSDLSSLLGTGDITVSPTTETIYYVICGKEKNCVDFDSVTVTVLNEPLVFDLALKKVIKGRHKNPTLRRGDQVTFEIKVYNQGNVDAKNMQIVDYIPNGLTLVTDSTWEIVGGKAYLVNPIASLVAKDSISVEITFMVNQDASGTITNIAEISSAENDEGLEDIDSTPDDNSGNDCDPYDDDVDGDAGTKPCDEDEDDHDIERINVCPDSKCLTAKSTKIK